MPQSMVMLGLFNLGGGEIVLVLAIVVIFFGADNQGKIAKWLWDCTDEEAVRGGRSVGGIYGTKPAQALTPHNTVAELYKPAAFENPEPRKRKRRKGFLKLLRALWLRVLHRVGWH